MGCGASTVSSPVQAAVAPEPAPATEAARSVPEPAAAPEPAPAPATAVVDDVPAAAPVEESAPVPAEQAFQSDEGSSADKRFVPDLKKWMSFAEYCAAKEVDSDDQKDRLKSSFMSFKMRHKTLTTGDKQNMIADMFTNTDADKSKQLSLIELWKGTQNFVNPLPAMINLAVQDVGQVDSAIDADEFHRYNSGTSLIKEPRFSQSLFNSLAKGPNSKFEKKFKGPISSMTVSKFIDNIAGEKKEYSDAEIDAFAETLRAANVDGSINKDKLSEVFDKNVDFDSWDVVPLPPTGEFDIKPDGLVTQQNFFDFVDSMCGPAANDVNKKGFADIEASLKAHISAHDFPERIKALAVDWNLLQHIKDTAVLVVMDNEPEMDFGTFVIQVGSVLEGQADINPDDDEPYEAPRASVGGASGRRKSQEYATEQSSAELKAALDQWARADFSKYGLPLPAPDCDQADLFDFIDECMEKTRLEKLIAMELCTSAGIPLDMRDTKFMSDSGLFAEVICFFCQFCATIISDATKQLIRSGGSAVAETEAANVDKPDTLMPVHDGDDVPMFDAPAEKGEVVPEVATEEKQEEIPAEA